MPSLVLKRVDDILKHCGGGHCVLDMLSYRLMVGQTFDSSVSEDRQTHLDQRLVSILHRLGHLYCDGRGLNGVV